MHAARTEEPPLPPPSGLGDPGPSLCIFFGDVSVKVFGSFFNHVVYFLLFEFSEFFNMMIFHTQIKTRHL